MIFALAAFAAEPFAAYDACVAGDPAACVAADEAYGPGGLSLWVAGCAVGADPLCAKLVMTQDPLRHHAEVLYRGCLVHGAPSACRYVGPRAPDEAVLAALCGEGVEAACRPLAPLSPVGGAVVGVDVRELPAAAEGGGVIPYADGLWVVGSAEVVSLADDGAVAYLPVAPAFLSARGRAVDVVPPRGGGVAVRWWPESGAVAPIACDIGPPFRAADGCRVVRRGSAVVVTRERGDEINQHADHLWVARGGKRVEVLDGVGPPVAGPAGRRVQVVGWIGERALVAVDTHLELVDPRDGAAVWRTADRVDGFDPQVSPDGRWVALRSRDAVRLIDPATGEVGYELWLDASRSAWTGQGDLALVRGRQLILLRVGAGTAQLPPLPRLVHPTPWSTPLPWVFRLVAEGADAPVVWTSPDRRVEIDGDRLVVPGDAAEVHVSVDGGLSPALRSLRGVPRVQETQWVLPVRRTTVHLQDCAGLGPWVRVGDDDVSGRIYPTDEGCAVTLPAMLGDAPLRVWADDRSG
ncbi:MAG: hypothetical protein ABMB14_22510, partial [Myxococcota bacterium]